MLDPLKRRCLQDMGIRLWVRRPPTAPDRDASPVPPREGTAEAGGDVAAMDWETLRRSVSACTRCDLHRSRTQTVFGVGDPAARWMVVGEAPGAEEDRRGEPFVGRAGQLLTNMLGALGLRRDQVFIANILKCRPPNNRDPSVQEVASCEPYLRRQIALVNPRLIIAVGRIAAHNLLGTTEPMSRLRGRILRLPGGETPVVVTYHPAYLLRSPRDKDKAWQDLKLARGVAAPLP